MTTYVMAVEGVLVGRDEYASVREEGPDKLGNALYASLATTGRLVLASDIDRRVLEHWLRIYLLDRHQALVPLAGDLAGRLRSAGEAPELYIDSNQDRTAAMMSDGVPVLLLARPLYSRLRMRPDVQERGHSVRPWAAVQAEARAQVAQRERPLLDLDQ